MTTIYERKHIDCPYVRAREYLRERLEQAAERHQIERMPLGVTLAPFPAAVEKNVLVWYERSSDPMHFDEPWTVRWTPEGGGPYPDFSGELTVRADDTYTHAVLELRGEYLPPLGIVGRGFDIVAGSKIASATVRKILDGIAQEMEARFHSEEARK
jgi:hypothetical protein